jgi:hypothetical protein
MTMVYDAVRSCDEDFVPLRLIERNTAFSSRYAMTIIARPTSQRSTCRLTGLESIVSVEARCFIGERPYPNLGRNVHHRHNS